MSTESGDATVNLRTHPIIHQGNQEFWVTHAKHTHKPH